MVTTYGKPGAIGSALEKSHLHAEPLVTAAKASESLTTVAPPNAGRMSLAERKRRQRNESRPIRQPVRARSNGPDSESGAPEVSDQAAEDNRLLAHGCDIYSQRLCRMWVFSPTDRTRST